MATMSMEGSSTGYNGQSSSSGGHGVVNGINGGSSLGHGMTDRNGQGVGAGHLGQDDRSMGIAMGMRRDQMGSVASDEMDDYGDGVERSGSTSGSTDIAGGSDEMLMTLLAGQAAVDCENLPVGQWEEVDAWKKELTILSNRLDSLVARHQREVKILTAARTLQKLNNANKRMSRQTMESLEQAEKRAEAAEKEVLLLRDREASLRRRLTEHWAGAMAWEVRRLAHISAQAEDKYRRQTMVLNANKAREDELTRQMAKMEQDLRRRTDRAEELEMRVEEMTRRERAIAEEVKGMDQLRLDMEREREEWARERAEWDQSRAMLERDRQGWEEERRGFDDERQGWSMEKRILQSEMETHKKDHQAALESGKMSERDRITMDRVRTTLAGMLGRKGGVGEAEIVDAAEDVRRLLTQREKEVLSLKEEMREVNMGLEEEVRRVSADRDLWKNRSEKGEQGRRDEMAALEKTVRTQADQISDMSLRNESLSTSLAAAQSNISSLASSSASTKTLQNRINSLEAELESIAGQFNEVWSILPSRSKRAEAELVDPRTGLSNASLASPSRAVNFAALQAVYTPNNEGFAGIDEMLKRVRGMVDDGKLLVERVCRLGQERELLKANAARAKKLAEDSQAALQTYQQQVAELEHKLASSGTAESKFLNELNSLRSALDSASTSKRQLETQLSTHTESINRLETANRSLSSKTLSLAEDAEKEKKILQKKMQDEIDRLKREVEEAQEEVDEARTRGSAQRIQLLDELNSLQAENADLRKQIRMRK
ncbi:Up-regulated during septation-domain-containing protein [Kockovaella imperatae]|uniref:Up-regulated during septation-domain-containing protein n=1 Tax=Kockovaella imperatae TaxID=4999 RepID=A0A1Y1UG66_9TREE|nr:Up-regulated during septation-domain-containing protein [Kockovaella imperatae]ORX36527.1 Up-regulated during septation-domain-containing protein [Kockovaella imperatae]